MGEKNSQREGRNLWPNRDVDLNAAFGTSRRFCPARLAAKLWSAVAESD